MRAVFSSDRYIVGFSVQVVAFEDRFLQKINEHEELAGGTPKKERSIRKW